MAVYTTLPCMHKGFAQPAQMLCKSSTPACISSCAPALSARRNFGPKVACFSHGTVAAGSSLSSTKLVLQSSGSHEHVLRPRVAQAPRMASRVNSTTGLPGVLQEGPEQLLLLLDHLKSMAGTSSSSSSSSMARGTPGTPAADIEAVKARMLTECKPKDKWLLVQCGEWQDYKGWSGPARTLVQVWATDAPRDDLFRLTLAYNMWELSPDGLPTGETFASGTAFEKATTRIRGNKYLVSCRLEPNPVCKDASSLGTWLTAEYGAYKVMAKYVVHETQRKRKDRKKEA